ncbi:MAG: hypothetical protein LBU32_30140 [Clostridiales bacterium]|jgi:uroporphyrinogen decarboxylase|nr:hypothetical protein [Clostridiales bacterium]
MREPDFANLARVLEKKRPHRPTLFEFFLNAKLYEDLAGFPFSPGLNMLSDEKVLIAAFSAAGYDYATIVGSDFSFKSGQSSSLKTKSINEGGVITDRESFNAYEWPDPDACDYSRLKRSGSLLPKNMKMIVWGDGGIFENAVKLVGYENLCYMLADDEILVTDIFEEVGSRFLRYYEICAGFDSVGAIISNDDWGFSSQTLLSAEDLRKYVFPWHKRIAEAAHKSGKYAILHSCGNLSEVMEDIWLDMGFDGKHSYEDKILPVERAYELYSDKIAILGGIDIDFCCRETPDRIRVRAEELIRKSDEKGSYALGTGNSIPDYLPRENYFAMISAAAGDLLR